MRIFLVILTFLLSACGAIQTRFTPETVKQPVNVYVRCTPKPLAEPAWAAKPPNVDPNSDIYTQNTHLRAEIGQREGYETELQARLTSCTTAPVSPVVPPTKGEVK